MVVRKGIPSAILIHEYDVAYVTGILSLVIAEVRMRCR